MTQVLFSVQGAGRDSAALILRRYFDGEAAMIGGGEFGALQHAHANGFRTLRERFPIAVNAHAGGVACIDVELGTLRRAGLPATAEELDLWRCMLLSACRTIRPEVKYGCYDSPEIWYNRPRTGDRADRSRVLSLVDVMMPRLYQRPEDGDLQGLMERAIAESRAANGGARVAPIIHADLWSDEMARGPLMRGAQHGGARQVTIWFQAEGGAGGWALPKWVKAWARGA